MIRYKITLTPRSPFLIGGHQLRDNHYETLEYVPAPNLQAALARRILEAHGGYDVEREAREGQKRYYIDSERIGVEGCEAKWIPWFQHFSQLRFTDCSPFGVEHFAASTFGCKLDRKHPQADFLSAFYRTRHQRSKGTRMACTCGERLERKSGWKWPEGKRLFKRTVTRVALDERRRVSADGQLFSLQIGEPFCDEQRTPLQFVGDLLVPEEIAQQFDFSVQDAGLRIGKHITVGLGRMCIQVEKVDSEPFPSQRIANWQATVGDTSVPLLLNGMLPVELPAFDESDEDDIETYCQAYAEWLKNKAGAPADLRVTFAYTQQTMRRNFQNGAMARQEQITRYLLPGSILVVDAEVQQGLQSWLEQIHAQGLHLSPHSSLVTLAPSFVLKEERHDHE
ncbi:hypothetical protein CIG75_05420 [Tumebacillus algifaecis]|uniref:CRISPR-associated RAMP protein Csx10 n=1 Tax=Tumebacillus algifaecis TaxID=1214604 RepID=A0A223CZH7_9BACL|nr:hypothetical protein [Tumebacillus algifaecis]ASS74487.1 hypothetical protein CIG75_05420 [Tumebacillus algifaecis]